MTSRASLPALALLAMATLLGGCATHDRVVLLPGLNGKVGKVYVQPRDANGGKPVLLDSAYAEAETSSNGDSEAAHSDAAGVQRDFGQVLSAMPKRPTMYVLYFEGDSTQLDSESRQRLPQVLGAIRERPAPEAVCIGHTDRVGTVDYNDKLGLARAEVVRDALVSIGLKAADITVSSRGEREPLVPTDDEVAEPQNRRVEVIVR